VRHGAVAAWPDHLTPEEASEGEGEEGVLPSNNNKARRR
jgi:hypothetical protein